MSPACESALDAGRFGGLTEDLVDAILEEAGRFASDEIAPLQQAGDREGAVLSGAEVTMPAGWKDLYRRWREGGWNGLSAPEEHGGQALPHALGAAALEMWNSGSMAFAIGPTLTMGAVEAIDRHASGSAEAALSRQARVGRMDRHDEPDRAAGRIRSRRRPGPCRAGRRRLLAHIRPEDLHHLWRARSDREHRPSGAGPAARRACRNARPLAVPGSEIPGRRGWRDRPAQRRLLLRSRAQARHSCLADLHDDLRRRLHAAERGGRLAGRRGKPRPRLHVHHDERCPAGGWNAGRRRRRSGIPEGAWPCQGAAPGQGAGVSRRRHVAHRPSSRTCSGCCSPCRR